MADIIKFKSKQQLFKESCREYTRKEAEAIINYMKPYEITPPEYLKTGKPQRVSFGLTFKKCFDYICNLPESCPEEIKQQVKLIHGFYYGYPGDIVSELEEPVIHAWIELPEGIIFDGDLQRFYKQGEYYRLLGCVKEAEYSIEEAARQVVNNKNYGIWHKQD